MPSFSRNLEETLHRAVAYANQRKHEYATLEHLLLSLTDDEDAAGVMGACDVDLAALKKTLAQDPTDSYAKQAITRQHELLGRLGGTRRKWDIVVLQSYRDDTQGAASSYLEYAPRFAALIKAQGYPESKTNATNYLKNFK